VRFSIVPIFLAVLPLLEIASFIVVGQQIGVLATISLVIFTTILGAVLLRVQGFGLMSRVRQTIEAGGVPGREVVHGFMILVAGILLVAPGFVTDTLGLLLFIPAVRDIAWNFFRQRVIIAGQGPGFGAHSSRQQREKVIDLNAEDYTSTGSKDTPWRRLDDE
jgi:UPF0716 protein FxsA